MKGAAFSRRNAIAAAAGTALGAAVLSERVDAAQFGVKGDGAADDTNGLQNAIDAAGARGGGIVTVPPGTYRVTRTVRLGGGGKGNITRQNGIIAHGARFISQVGAGAPVFHLASAANHRFLLIDGLDIQGSGRDGHGLVLECESNSSYLYNFCLRDVVVQNCGGDGCRLVGNVFEGQVVNGYFRDNHGNGITFSHGEKAGALSAVHVFGSVFGQNGGNGAAMLRNCYDVAFHGCYFLLNGKFGLLADNGCTLLSNCGFENNHTSARDYAHGDAGVSLNSFGTMIGCTAYSVQKQTALVKTYLTAPLTMIGCSGAGSGPAAAAGLAKFAGMPTGSATVIGCQGAIEHAPGFATVVMGGKEGGVRFSSEWNSKSLLTLGEYVLWVGADGKLRVKNGTPGSDMDGAAVGAG